LNGVHVRSAGGFGTQADGLVLSAQTQDIANAQRGGAQNIGLQRDAVAIAVTNESTDSIFSAARMAEVASAEPADFFGIIRHDDSVQDRRKETRQLANRPGIAGAEGQTLRRQGLSARTQGLRQFASHFLLPDS